MRTFKRVHSFSLEGDARTESVAFSRDGRLMLTVCSDGRGRLFDSASKAEVRLRSSWVDHLFCDEQRRACCAAAD